MPSCAVAPAPVKFVSMCTLAIYFRATREWPVVIAANRDELLERPAADPTTLLDSPHVVGGRDLKAGGTWLGINEYGLVAGLLNRRSDAAPNPDARSRGLLCLDALKFATAADAAAFTRAQRGADYNPFNLLIASRDAAYVAHNRAGTIELLELAPGMHLLTNLDLDDFECPRISRAFRHFGELGECDDFRRDPVRARARLIALLSDHMTQLDARTGRPNSLCLHLEGYGTRSSSLIFVGAEPGRIEHFFAPGPPCRTEYVRAAVPRPAQPK
jgi:uncharacterized protein with NRDE domain